MFFTGYGGGLELDMKDEKGKPITARSFSHAILPQPRPDGMSVLVRLDDGFFYGTSAGLPVKDFFPKPGRYSILVNYKSMVSVSLRKGCMAHIVFSPAPCRRKDTNDR